MSKVLANKNWGTERQTNQQTTLITSKLDYGTIAYSSFSKLSLKRLDTIHNATFRLILGALRKTSIENLRCEAAEPSFQERIMY